MSKEIQKVELKESDRELLKTFIESTKKPTATATPTEHKHEEPKHEHFTVDASYLEQADACPECKKGLDDFGKEYMRKKLEGQKDLSHECVNCGLGVDGKVSEPMDWKCPNCGEGNAKER